MFSKLLMVLFLFTNLFLFNSIGYGEVRKETAAKVGELLGAQFLISGAVTEFDEKVMDAGGLGIVLPFGMGVGAKVTKAYVVVDVRMYDTTTGVVVYAETVEKKPYSLGVAVGAVDIGRLRGIGGVWESKTPLGKATRECIKDIVNLIVLQSDKVVWRGRIVNVKNEKIFLNIGSNSGMKTGTKLNVYSLGEEMIDPETGLSLGGEETQIGVVKIIEIKDKYSIAEIETGEGFQQGNIVRLQEGKKEISPARRVAVAGFENKVPCANWQIGDGMSEMLITELVKTKKFIVLERKELDAVLAEQNLGKKDPVDTPEVKTVPPIPIPQFVQIGIPSQFPIPPMGIPDLSPDEETVSTIAEFTWPKIQGVVSYQVMIYKRGESNNPIWSVRVPDSITKIKFGEIPEGGVGVQLTKPLESKQKYEWTVIGIDNKNQIIAIGNAVFKTK